MKTPLSLGLLLAAAGLISACSSDEGKDRNDGGTGGQVAAAGTGGTGSGGTGTGGTGVTGGGTGGTGAGGTSALPAGARVGAALTIPAEGPITDDTEGTGIRGGTAVTQSTNMTVDATISTREGGLCFKGTTATVPDANSYGTYWGAEMIFDLKRGPNPDAPPVVADAGGDAGPAILEVATDWPKGNVIGFSFTLTGNNPAAADQGVPNAHIRFKSAPVGADTAQDNYCNTLTAPASGTPISVLYKDITFECWQAGNYSLDDNPIQYVEVVNPKTVGTRPNPGAFRSISWQIASDLMIDPIAFDFCVTDLKPILSN
jgi:hypothetical protein